MKYFVAQFSILVVIVLTTLAFSSTESTNSAESNMSGIDFADSNIESLIQRAESEQKLVYVSFYTTWCAPCQIMKLRTYRNGSVGSYFNENFISIEINGDKGEGTEIAERYGVDSFPTLVFLEPDGSLFYKTTGFHNAEELLEVAKEVTQLYSKQKYGL